MPSGLPIFIPGNTIQLGNWDPAKVELAKTSEGYFQIILAFEKGTIIEYKITRGDWMNEAVSKEGVVPGNTVMTIEKNSVVDIVVENWRDMTHIIQGNVTGTGV